MSNDLLDEFGEALRQRNPVLADRLRPGLPLSRIRKMLARAKVEGLLKPIECLYAWKNGTRLDPSIKDLASPFPESVYMFMDLEMMLADFSGFKELAAYHPEYAVLVGRYFPVFWDGSTSWLAIDLSPAMGSRVVLIDPETGTAARDVYPSFEEFLKDAIRANRENDTLTCFYVR